MVGSRRDGRPAARLIAPALAGLALLAVCLPATAGVKVRVLDPSGQPASGARLVATAPALTIVAVGAEGVASLPDGTTKAWAASVTWAPAPIPLQPAPADVVTVTLAPGASVSGRVVDGAGHPRPSATVSVSATSVPAGVLAPAIAGADGSYRLEGLPAGLLTLEASLPPSRSPEPLMVRVASGATARADVRLRPWCSLHVKVTGADGKPVAGASVSVHGGRGSLDPPLTPREHAAVAAATGATSSSGEVEIPLPQRAAWRVAAVAPSLAPRSTSVAALAGTASVPLTLTSGASLMLRVMDDSGVPRARPVLRLASADATDVDLVPAPPVGGSDGRLAVSHLPPGSYALEVRAAGARPRFVHGVALREGATKDLGDVILQPGVTLSGVVTGDGAPLAGASVTLHGFTEGKRSTTDMKADAEGRFVFEGLDPDQAVAVSAKAPGWTEHREEGVPPATTDLALALSRASRVVVTATDAESGDPLTEFTARLDPIGPPSAQRLWGSAYAGPHPADAVDGTATFDSVVPGDWKVHVEAPGHAAGESQPQHLDAGGELPVAVAVPRGLSIQGRVLDGQTRQPVFGVALTATGSGHDVKAQSDLDGTFKLDGVLGKVDVHADHPSYQQAEVDAVDPSAGEPLEIALSRGGAVEGVVRGPDGQAAVGAEVRCSRVDRAAVTGDDGHYRLDGLPEGDADLVKVDRPESFEGLEQAAVRIVAGTTAHHDFGGGMRLVGHVTFRGEPAAGARLSAASAADPGPTRGLHGASATVGEDGAYTLAGLAPGLWTVLVAWQDRHFGIDVTLGEGETVVQRDVEIPDLHLGGTVVDKSTGHPVPGATVTGRPVDPANAGRSQSMMMMATVTDDGGSDELVMSTMPESEATSDRDGRFSLILAGPGRYGVSVRANGLRWVKPEGQDAPPPVDVTTSRDDLVLEMEPEDSTNDKTASVTIRATDAETGEAISNFDGMVAMQHSLMASSGNGPKVFPQLAAGKPLDVMASAPGHAPAWRRGVVLATGDKQTISLTLGRGGDLRILAPPGALHVDPVKGMTGASLVDATGFDLLGGAMLQGNWLVGNVEQPVDGEILVHHVPAGAWTLGLGAPGSGHATSVDILDGQEADASLR